MSLGLVRKGREALSGVTKYFFGEKLVDTMLNPEDAMIILDSVEGGDYSIRSLEIAHLDSDLFFTREVKDGLQSLRGAMENGVRDICYKIKRKSGTDKHYLHVKSVPDFNVYYGIPTSEQYMVKWESKRSS